MTRRTLIVLGLAVTALLAAIVVMVISRDGDTGDGGHLGGDSEFDIHGPTPQNATAPIAAEQALATMFSWQPRHDASPGVAVTRAKPWLSGELAADADSPPATGIRTLPQWAGWREAGDIVVGSAHAITDCTPVAGHCLVKVTLTQTVLHTDGTSTPWRVLAVDATTADTPNGWRLSAYRITG